MMCSLPKTDFCESSRYLGGPRTVLWNGGKSTGWRSETVSEWKENVDSCGFQCLKKN